LLATESKKSKIAITYPAKVQKEPATGMKAAISPRDSMVVKTMAPTMA
jgi:hypothetical protein